MHSISGYALEDFVPYGRETWYGLFEQYNPEAWPLVALWLVVAAIRIQRARSSGEPLLTRWPILLSLAICWAWIGWRFHGQHHQQFNWAAHYWAWAFAIQATGLCLQALAERRREQRPILLLIPARSPAAKLTRHLMLIALVLPPLLGWWLAGRPAHGLEVAGIAPDPTAWLTLLILIAPTDPQSRTGGMLLIIPLVSLLVSSAAAQVIGATDMLLVNALATLSCLALLICRYKNG